MILKPNSLAVGDRVRHDLSNKCGTVTELFTERGHKSMPVEYAKVSFDNGGFPVKHAVAMLTKL